MSQKETTPAHLIDRVYALLHQLEEEQDRRQHEHEPDDFLDGVASGTQAAKRQLILRLHWVLDPSAPVVDVPGTELLAPGQGACDDDGASDPDLSD